MLLLPKRWQRTISMIIGIDIALCVIHSPPQHTVDLRKKAANRLRSTRVQEANTGEAKID